MIEEVLSIKGNSPVTEVDVMKGTWEGLNDKEAARHGTYRKAPMLRHFLKGLWATVRH